ncbi:CynX/NimT family MFS transporter [Natronosalvus rutilus]|uniref:MFS transporter n=1 Tax=Natronosalvus rutilus TaxID=2953753 RepID=A0A9E7SZ51_9EURY|nr:MFS transporter [Natronosalvus rutilus]UTF55663.1 MFS transporter [Natronosalvus rutilus]
MNRHHRWVVTFFGWGLYFSFTFAWYTLAALLPRVLEEVTMTSLATGILLGAVSAVMALTWMVMGPLVDRVGPGPAMGVGVAVLGFAAAFRGVASGFPLLFASMIVIALGGSTVTYGLPRALSSYFPADEVGTPIGIVTVGAQFGSLAAFGVMPQVSSFVGGWQPAFALSGIPAMVFAAGWLVFYERDSTAEKSSPPSVATVRRLFFQPGILALVAAGFMYLFATHSTLGWLATLLSTRGFSAKTASQLVAVLIAGQILGTLVVPALSDRVGHRAAFIGATGVSFTFGMVSFAVFSTRLLPLVGVGIVSGLALGGISPLLRVLPMELVSQDTLSTVISMIFGVGAIGGFLGPVLVGATLESTTLFAGFGILALPGVAFMIISVAFARLE